MKAVTTIRVRQAAAAAAMGMLLTLTACSQSDVEGDAPAATGTEDVQEESPAAEEVAEPAEEETTEEEAPEEEPAAAGDVVVPAEDFDPCGAVTAEQVGEAAGFAVGEGSAEELMGSQTCTFASSEGLAASVLLQWIPVEGDLDATVESATSAYENVSEPEDVTVPGTARSVAVTGETMSMPAAVVISQVEGGFFQVMVIGEDGDVAQAAALTEVTIASLRTA
ncbi:hypothetical protein LQF12_01520 [Ruania suaedae]|uniref:hypothetical protein n=1 Tax=Ruania suaedae TaxID=2897774 RepID=UPI001E50BD0E|nr:hypothetical protein [Ruania suaedae]UFU03319.1 hypothetical protein LQF12_01520 [Ruania suaedae]